MKRALCGWLVGLVIVLLSAGARAEEPVSAAAFESRLYAPCCYGGTLDIHDSELAHDLRKEIDGRLGKGESTDSIQADFVERYGDRVLAARSDKPAKFTGAFLGILFAAIALALGLAVRRWTRRSRSAPAAVPAERDALDDRIDAELEELGG